MPVLAFRCFEIPVVQPLLQLTGLTDLHRGKTFLHFRELRAETRIDPEDLRRLRALVKQIANDLSVHRRSGTDRDFTRMFILGRDRRARHQPLAARFFDESVDKKLRRTLHRRISSGKKLFITSELVVLPEMRAQPRAARGPEAP